MQTFLPYPDFRLSLEALDSKRLGKQRVEALQIINALRGMSRGWRNHPATRMWAGHLEALNLYMAVSIEVWVARGYRNTMRPDPELFTLTPRMPDWLGDPRVHSSHRSALLRKMPEHYTRLGWSDDPEQPYYWPVQSTH